MNFGRGEVAERLQCMSDLGFNERLTPAEPTPASAERRFINARAIAKPTLATARYR